MRGRLTRDRVIARLAPGIAPAPGYDHPLVVLADGGAPEALRGFAGRAGGPWIRPQPVPIRANLNTVQIHYTTWIAARPLDDVDPAAETTATLAERLRLSAATPNARLTEMLEQARHSLRCYLDACFKPAGGLTIDIEGAPPRLVIRRRDPNRVWL